MNAGPSQASPSRGAWHLLDRLARVRRLVQASDLGRRVLDATRAGLVGAGSRGAERAKGTAGWGGSRARAELRQRVARARERRLHSPFEERSIRERIGVIARRLAGRTALVFALALLGWALFPWAWPVVGVALALGTEAVVFLLAPGPERVLVRPAGWSAAVWLTLAWLGSPVTPALAVGAPGLVLLWEALWWAYGPLVAQAERRAIPAPAPAPAIGTVARLLEGWPGVSERLGLAGVGAELAGEDSRIAHLRLRLPTGVLPRHVVGKADLIEGAFRLRPGSLRVEGDLDRADHAHAFVTLEDPLRVPHPYRTSSARSIAEPLTLGVSCDGAPLALTLGGRHAIICGLPDSGKSMLLNVAVAEAAARRDVVLWGIDVWKVGVELGPWNPAPDVQVFQRLAESAPDAVQMLAATLAVQQARAAWMRARRLKDWPTSPAQPRLLVVIDELTALIDQLGSAGLLEEIAMSVRQQGINLLAATQRVTADALGRSTGFRASCEIRIAMKLQERGQSVAIMGSDAVADGWAPHELGSRRPEVALPGLLLISSPQHRLPRPHRSSYLPVERIEALAREWAPRMAKLDEASRAACERPVVPRGEALDTATVLLDAMLAEAPEGGTETGAFERAIEALPASQRRSERWVRDRLGERGHKVAHGRWRQHREGERAG